MVLVAADRSVHVDLAERDAAGVERERQGELGRGPGGRIGALTACREGRAAQRQGQKGKRRRIGISSCSTRLRSLEA